VIDTQQSKFEYVQSQLGSDVEYADLEARNIFNEGVISSKMKCIAGFNHYREHSYIIYNKLVQMSALDVCKLNHGII